MKNKLILIIVLVSIIGGNAGCKKGDEDPFISFLSRKARICGEWKVTEGRITYGSPDVDEIDYYSEDGKIIVQADHASVTGKYYWNFEIKKNGTYKIYKSVDIPYNTVYSTTEEGYWYFLTRNKGNDKKTKECIAFQPLTIKEDLITYEYQTCNPIVYDIIKLSNKQIKLEGLRGYKKTDGTAQPIATTDLSVFETIVLTPK
jgi:hypothetical protein